MKLACQEGLAVGSDLKQKLDLLAEAGYEGIEFSGSGLKERIPEILRLTANHPVKPSTICAGFRGCPLDADKRERELASSDIVSLLHTAGELGMVGLIMVPVFGGPRIPDLSPYSSAMTLELELLTKLCDDWAVVAESANTCLLLEPLNRYETHLLKTLEDAVTICNRVQSPHLKIMADFFHMSIEESSIPDSIEAAAPHIAHVHLADSNRQLPGYGHTDFASGFAALRKHRFTGYMALECGNPAENKQEGLKHAAEYLNNCLALR